MADHSNDKNDGFTEPNKFEVTINNSKLINRHRGAIVWFTGLSGSGKSTISRNVEVHLLRLNCNTFVLDGDNIRRGLCSDLGYSPEDRQENVRRIGEVAKLFLEAGIIVLVAFISPFNKDRSIVRRMINNGEFIEVFCNSPLEVCEKRDVKGLYEKARTGEISEFTGITSVYEQPENPEINLNTFDISEMESTKIVVEYLKLKKII